MARAHPQRRTRVARHLRTREPAAPIARRSSRAAVRSHHAPRRRSCLALPQSSISRRAWRSSARSPSACRAPTPQRPSCHLRKCSSPSPRAVRERPELRVVRSRAGSLVPPRAPLPIRSADDQLSMDARGNSRRCYGRTRNYSRAGQGFDARDAGNVRNDCPSGHQR